MGEHFNLPLGCQGQGMPFRAEVGAANTRAVFPFSLLSQARVVVGKNVRNLLRVYYRVKAPRRSFK